MVEGTWLRGGSGIHSSVAVRLYVPHEGIFEGTDNPDIPRFSKWIAGDSPPTMQLRANRLDTTIDSDTAITHLASVELVLQDALCDCTWWLETPQNSSAWSAPEVYSGNTAGLTPPKPVFKSPTRVAATVINALILVQRAVDELTRNARAFGWGEDYAGTLSQISVSDNPFRIS